MLFLIQTNATLRTIAVRKVSATDRLSGVNVQKASQERGALSGQVRKLL